MQALITWDKNWAEVPAVAELPGEEEWGPQKSRRRDSYYPWQENRNNISNVYQAGSHMAGPLLSTSCLDHVVLPNDSERQVLPLGPSPHALCPFYRKLRLQEVEVTSHGLKQRLLLIIPAQKGSALAGTWQANPLMVQRDTW